MLLKQSGLVKLSRVILLIGLSFSVFCISACFDLLGGNGGNSNGLTNGPDNTDSPTDEGETDPPGEDEDTGEGITIQFFAYSDFEWGERWMSQIALLPYLPQGSKITGGRIYTITIQGTSDREMNNLQGGLVDDPESSFKELSPWFDGRYIPKGNFSLTLSLSAYSSAADTSEKANMLHLENKTAFPAGYKHGDLIATLSNVKISVEVDDPPSGTVKLRGNTNSGAWEGIALPSTVPALKKNTSYKLTMTGTSDRAMNHFFVRSNNNGTELVSNSYNGPQGHIPTGNFTLEQYINTMNIDAVENHENFYFLLTEKPDFVPVEADSKVMATLSNIQFSMVEQAKRTVTLYAYGPGWHNVDICINPYLGKELKKNTAYSVTIKGTNDTPMNSLSFSFGNASPYEWVDTSNYEGIGALPAGYFDLTKTITTNSKDAIINLQDYNVLFLYNDEMISASDEGAVMATFKIDSISIMEL